MSTPGHACVYCRSGWHASDAPAHFGALVVYVVYLTWPKIFSGRQAAEVYTDKARADARAAHLTNMAADTHHPDCDVEYVVEEARYFA